MDKVDYRQKHKVYKAIERDSLNADPRLYEQAHIDMTAFLSKSLSAQRWIHYLIREEEYRTLTS